MKRDLKEEQRRARVRSRVVELKWANASKREVRAEYYPTQKGAK